MLLRPLNFLLFLLLSSLLASCRSTPDNPPLFTKIGVDESGVNFNNQIQPFEGETLNANTYDPMYNGAGVGVGDFNNDGWQDLFFAGNKVTSRLYLNRIDTAASANTGFRFEDVTQQAGLQTKRWCTGVSVVDVNQDGWLDIYVSVAGPDAVGAVRKNMLFLNQTCAKGGIPTFRDVAEQVGLADSGMNTQAAFFDYDHDGDLDCYILNNAFEKTGRNSIRPRRLDGSGLSTDRLYRNEGAGSVEYGAEGMEKNPEKQSRASNASSSTPHAPHPLPHFTDVSRQAGVVAEGYGLGLAVADLNQDGWLDVYCANDFLSNDVVWINNQDGTFTDRAADYFKHTSYNSMGVDIQDVNNDDRPDVMVVDMMPETNERQKMMLVKTNWDFFTLARQQGYQDEYVRNTLQLNQGEPSPSATGAIPSPVFSEIGQLAGVARTDWSWAPLLADLDNDGWKDLTISSGYRRDITNLDYVVYLNEQISRYGLSATHQQTLDALYKLPEIKVHNYVYRNNGGDRSGDLTFDDKSLDWGLGDLNFSNGAAYADLDNDGDLDLVFNNIDEPAGLYRNETNQTGKPVERHFLRFKLPADAHGSGAEIRLTLPDGSTQTLLAHPVRGYTSSVESMAHFGLGKHRAATVDIRWADGLIQTLGLLQADRVHTITYQPTAASPQPPPVREPYFKTQPAALIGIPFQHQEALSSDWQRTPMLAQVYAKNGPAVAIADVDGNGLDDVFIGADPGQLRTIYLQTKPGQFSALVQGANALEDMGALFFDADADGDPDLYVVSGGTQQPDSNSVYQDRLYLNDGHGKFTRSQGMLPPTTSSGSCVVAVDFDHDGDLDLFRGGRVKVDHYPYPPRSYLLRNDNGRFTDVTDQLAPGLRQVGMICSALWTDYDNDGWPDLMLAGEFMPITLFRNLKTRFQLQPTTLPAGQWNSITGADFDRDGDIDYVAGNTGLNTKYRASATEPLRVYGKDFDGNGKIDPILTYYLQGTEQVAAIRDVVNDQMTTLSRKRFTSFQAYAQKSFAEMFTDEERAGAIRLEATELRSVYIENKGNGRSGVADFAIHALPIMAQIAPVFGIQTDDFNGDGWRDVLLVGNSYAPETYSGWYDASRGTLLLGDGKGHFRAIPPTEAGVQLDGDSKGLALLSTGTSVCYVATSNNGPVHCLTPLRTDHRPQQRWRTTETTSLVKHANGQTERIEQYYGSGYLSQSSRVK
ncbi:VCBS repeat-containing protein [Spirosoma jeollabukense]